MSFARFPIAAASLALAVTLLPSIAHAELGGAMTGVRSDAAHMGARMATVAKRGYNRHDLTRTNGGGVHEFTNAGGDVFAVTWSGPGKPDLRSLLGRYFAAYQAAPAGSGRMMHSLRRPPQVSQPDLQIQAGGHMGWFHGVAFIPSLAPAGFSTADLPEQP